jgi:uncharacterized protein YegP (UPF0339 family)
MPAEYRIFEDKGSTPSEPQWRWSLVAANGEVVAQSEAYTSRSDAERGARDAKATSNEAAPVVVERSASLTMRMKGSTE